VLLSGDHEAIAEWREAESKKITEERRQDLLRKCKGTGEGVNR
jgi:tRNA (guanine-N1)-methyltransferase